MRSEVKWPCLSQREESKGFVGRRGAQWLAGCSNWSVLNMAGPVGTNGQMVVAPGSLQQHRTLSFLVLVFMSCPSFPFSYFLPYFIHLLFFTSFFPCYLLIAFCSLWWCCRGWIWPLRWWLAGAMSSLRWHLKAFGHGIHSAAPAAVPTARTVTLLQLHSFNLLAMPSCDPTPGLQRLFKWKNVVYPISRSSDIWPPFYPLMASTC